MGEDVVPPPVQGKPRGEDVVLSPVQGNNDGASMLSTCYEVQVAVAAMKEPAEARKQTLMQPRLQEFNFDTTDKAEKRASVTAPAEVSSMQQAQSHQVVIDKASAEEQNVVKAVEAIQQIQSDMVNIVAKEIMIPAKIHNTVVGVGGKLIQSIMSECGGVSINFPENGFGSDKVTVCGPVDGGESSVKLLAKHKTRELEIDTYSGIIREMTATADKLVAGQYPDSRLIKTRAEGLGRKLKGLQQKEKARRDSWVMAIQLHKYRRESGGFLAWVCLQLGSARSVDTGQDYEQWELLLARCQEFKLHVQAGKDELSNCESLAKCLKQAHKGKSEAEEVSAEQAKLTGEWHDLIGAIEEQDAALQAAGEIHCFNRDITEALSKIQEKGAILETGDTASTECHTLTAGDTKSAQSHIRKHEGFENDLVTLEGQLQVLINDSAALQALYPGEGAAKMLASQERVLAPCVEVQEKAGQGMASLLSSVDYHSFHGMVQDLLAWSSRLRRSLITEAKVSDAVPTQMLRTENENPRAELGTREKTFIKGSQEALRIIADPITTMEGLYVNAVYGNAVYGNEVYGNEVYGNVPFERIGTDKATKESVGLQVGTICVLCWSHSPPPVKVKESAGRPFHWGHGGKGLYQKSRLTMHMKVHTERKPYSRSDCEKSFAVDGRLMAHRRVHSGDKPHSCARCGKMFSLSGNLKTHAWLHESGEEFQCHLCEKVYPRADNLRQHILSFHEVKNKEVKFLLDKPSLECIQKENRDHSYVPTNNVKEAKHKIGSVKMKKPVTVKDIRKLFNISSEWVNFNERIYKESKAIHTTEADMAAKLPKEFLDFSADKKCLEKIDAATVELIFPVPGQKKETAARQGGTHEIYCDLVKLQEALCLTDDPPKDEESEGWVETEVCEAEPFKGTRTKEVIEERRAPQVKTLFTYTGRMHEVNKWITTHFALTVVEGYVNSGKHVSRVQELRPCFLTEDDAHKETVPCKTIDISLILNLKELISAKREALGLKNQVHVFDKDADEMISSVPGMKAKISADEHRQVLGAVQGLRGRQRGLQEERAATQQQVVAVEKEAAGLGGLSPATLAQIEARREGAQIVIATLPHLSRQRGEKVNQRVKRSFSINRKLMALTNKIIIEVGKITSPDLTADLTGAETWIVRQKEPKSGIKEKQDSFGGQEGHFMSSKNWGRDLHAKL